MRRNARDELVLAGPPSVESLMAALAAEPSNYRMRIGAAYVLRSLLTVRPNDRAAVSSALRDEHLALLVELASDDDKTLRLQAGEFLVLLADPRSIQYSVQAARKATDNNKAFNQIIITGGASRELPEAERERVFRDITSGPGPNNDVVRMNEYIRKSLGF